MPLPDIEHRLRTTIASEHLADNMSDIYDILRSVGMVDRSLIQAGVYILYPPPGGGEMTVSRLEVKNDYRYVPDSVEGVKRN